MRCSVGKASACNAGDPALIPGSGRSPGEGNGYPFQYSWASLVTQLVPRFDPWVGKIPGEGKGSPLQFSGLESSMDCIVHGVAKSWTRPSNFHFQFQAVHRAVPLVATGWGLPGDTFSHCPLCPPLSVEWESASLSVQWCKLKCVHAEGSLKEGSETRELDWGLTEWKGWAGSRARKEGTLRAQVRQEWLTEGRARPNKRHPEAATKWAGFTLGWGHQIYLWMPRLHPNCSGRKVRQTHFKSSIDWPVLNSWAKMTMQVQVWPCV